MSRAPAPAAAGSRWRARFPSLGARLMGLFIVLAVAVAATFLLGLHVVQHGGWRIARRLPDGHRIVFGLADMSHEQRSEHVGWMTLAVLLLLTALAYAVVRHMLRPLAALRAGAVRYGQGDFSRPIVPRNRDEL